MIEITNDAREQIKDMLKDEPENSYLKFGVKGGGCSGLSYAIEFVETVNEDLETVTVINDIPVTITNMDIPIIKDTVIDFKQNMMGGGFTINNPNAIFSCGCGSSFRTEAVSGAPGDC